MTSRPSRPETSTPSLAALADYRIPESRRRVRPAGPSLADYRKERQAGKPRRRQHQFSLLERCRVSEWIDRRVAPRLRQVTGAHSSGVLLRAVYDNSIAWGLARTAASQEQIADRVGLKVRQVRTLVRALVVYGVLHVTPNGDYSLYEIAIPPDLEGVPKNIKGTKRWQDRVVWDLPAERASAQRDPAGGSNSLTRSALHCRWSRVI